MPESARERILAVAGQLFYQHGYRAIGVDTIIAASGVAKATLYRHFPSKDDLIAAYLEETNAKFWAWFDTAAALHPTDPYQQVVAVYDALQKLVTTPTCYGCPFIIAVGEFPEPEHVAHQVAVANKVALRERLLALCQALDMDNPQALANHLYLLMDGAFAAVRTFGLDNPATRVGDYARMLLAAAVGR